MKNSLLLMIELLALVLFCSVTGTLVQAQVAGNGEVQGTITDSSGAVIPNASVVATNVSTGVTTKTLTTGAGLYVLSPLAPGDYTISVNAPGFAPLLQEHLTVNALTIVSLNLRLKVGANVQQVTVTSTPPALNTSNGTLGITINSEAYANLPLAMNGGPRATDGFITLLPGVQSFPLIGGGFSINGGAAATNQVYINGLPSVNTINTGGDFTLDIGFAIEAIDQFQIDTNGTPAMYQGQGAENFMLKSGTNKLHGNLYEYLRNTIFDAAGFFNPTTPIEKQNEFGGSIGGPILRNRLFYFGNYDGYRLRQLGQYGYNSIPTAAERSGDFSALPVPIYDPNTTICASGGNCTRQQFPGNIIPPGRISAISSFFQSELPDASNPNLQSNYLGGLFPGVNQNRYLIKIDGTLSQNDRVYGFGDWGNYSNPTLPPGATILPQPYSSAQYTIFDTYIDGFGYTHIFSPHLVNELNAEYDREVIGTVNPTAGGGWPGKAGLTGLPQGAASDVFPPVIFNGPNSPTSWDILGNTAAWKHTSNTYGLGDALQWSHGRQNLVFGTQISVEQVGQDETSFVNEFEFDNNETAGFGSNGELLTSTGNAYASYLLGLVDTGIVQQSAVDEVGGSTKDYSVFVQDDMKATSRLTLNLGLRYDIYTPFVMRGNQESWLNPSQPNTAVDGYPGSLQFAGFGEDSCGCRSPLPTYFGNVGPRIGFAYALNEKTVIRGSYGIFFVQGGAQGGGGQSEGTGQTGYIAQPYFPSINGGISPGLNWNSGFPAYTHAPTFDPTLGSGSNTTEPYPGVISSYGDYSHALRSPYSQNWSLTVEREIARDTVINASYSASTSHFLPTVAGIGIYSNQIQPRYLALGNLLLAAATPANVAAAQSIMPEIHLPFANYQGTIGQMLTPFPQYAGINDIYPMVGNANYNSLQVSAQKRLSRGLTFLLSYTHSKEIDDADSNNILAVNGLAVGRTAYNARLERAVGQDNVPNMFSASYVYNLPFGTGHKLGSGNRFARALTSNWLISGIQTYTQGIPLGPFTGACNAPYTGQCDASYNPSFSGHVRINGSYGSGYVIGSLKPYIDINAFTNPAAYTLGNTPRTQPFGLHNPPVFNENFSLAREFPVREDMRLKLEASAFNAFNRTELGGINTSITSANFGAITGQINAPRNLQFDAKFSF